MLCFQKQCLLYYQKPKHKMELTFGPIGPTGPEIPCLPGGPCGPWKIKIMEI